MITHYKPTRYLYGGTASDNLFWMSLQEVIILNPRRPAKRRAAKRKSSPRRKTTTKRRSSAKRKTTSKRKKGGTKMARRKTTRRKKAARRKTTTRRRRAPARRRKSRRRKSPARRRKTTRRRRKTTRRRKPARRRKTTRRRKPARRRKTTRRRKPARRRKTTRRRKPARRRKTTRRRKPARRRRRRTARRRPARRRTARRKTAVSRRRRSKSLLPKLGKGGRVSLKGFMTFMKKHIDLGTFGAIAVGLALPQVAGGLYQRVFNMLGNPGAQVSSWMASNTGQYVTGIVGTAGILYLANRLGVVSDRVALMAAGVSTSVVLLSYASSMVSGRWGGYIPNMFAPTLNGYSGQVGGYGGYLGYLGNVEEEMVSPVDASGGGAMFGYNSGAGKVNIF